MTLLKPTISISRLIITKGDKHAFDAKFHSGVNIISGHNASGKTTVMDFIAYGLGAENIPWKKEALLCNETIIEVRLNGNPITLKRPISTAKLNPLQIFWGDIETARRAPSSQWETYPFKRTSNSISFTQAILLALGLPEATGDGASNLTMHQFLRVIYADQPSLHSPIFRVDTFDNSLTRETVGNYLCGIFDDSLYSAQLEQREVEKDLLRLDAELSSIFRVLGKSGQTPLVEFLDGREKQLNAELSDLQEKLSSLRMRQSSNSLSATEPSDDSALREQLSEAKAKFVGAQEEITRAELQIEDSKLFISEIKARLAALDDSGKARSYFESMSFEFCPCCLSKIELTETSNSCPLCKGNASDSTDNPQILRMRNELRIQRDESIRLVKEKSEQIARLHTELPGLKFNLRLLEKRFKEASRTWSTSLEQEIEATSRREGELLQELRFNAEQKKLADAVSALRESRDAAKIRLSNLNDKITLLTSAQEDRKDRVIYEISTRLRKLLRQDLHRQEEFSDAHDVQFSFADNSVSVDGSTKFSESSTVVLRHLFHVALLSSSATLGEMRFPRLLLLDGIEDGGLELERAHLLQEIIVDECKTFTCEYQLIMASSQISPSLNTPSYVIQRTFTETDHTLSI